MDYRKRLLKRLSSTASGWFETSRNSLKGEYGIASNYQKLRSRITRKSYQQNRHRPSLKRLMFLLLVYSVLKILRNLVQGLKDQSPPSRASRVFSWLILLGLKLVALWLIIAVRIVVKAIRRFGLWE